MQYLFVYLVCAYAELILFFLLWRKIFTDTPLLLGAEQASVGFLLAKNLYGDLSR